MERVRIYLTYLLFCVILPTNVIFLLRICLIVQFQYACVTSDEMCAPVPTCMSYLTPYPVPSTVLVAGQITEHWLEVSQAISRL